MPQLLAITYDLVVGQPEVYRCNALSSKSFSKEPAGHVFHHVALLQSGVIAESRDRDDEAGANAGAPVDSKQPGLGSRTSSATNVDFSSLDAGGATDDSAFSAKNRKRKIKKKENRKDLYALLGLQYERHLASENDIRKAYRKAALEHHPDKKRAASQHDLALLEENEERFKAIQDAYETLSDPAKRREFDSLDPFDDSLPKESACANDADEFIRQFSAAFARNAKWSVKQPVPPFPEGMDASDAVVDAFYSFWFSFKSWREFPHPDEEDVEQAESRYERRWIEKHNAKLREDGRKAEIRRINEFVGLAHRLDPRIVARREAEKAERERAKAEKEMAREARRAEEARLEAAAAARAKAEEEVALQAKKQRQFEKKALQKERAKLRKQVAGNTAGLLDGKDPELVEKVCGFLDLEELTGLNASLTAASLAAAIDTAVRKEQEELDAKAAAGRAAALNTKKEEKEALQTRLKKLETWTEEEVRLLNKAIDKFPPGTSRRWETVQLYLRTRTVDEILDMVKYGLKSGKFLAPKDEVVIAEKKKTKLANTLGKTSCGDPQATQRHESFTDVQIGVEACEWTKEEDLALVKALKEHGKELGESRWDLVAKAVGRGKVDCAKRFKEMKAQHKKDTKKTTA